MEVQSDKRHGTYICFEDFELFLRKFSSAAVRHDDVAMLLKRFDKDGDSKISFEEF